MNDVREKLFMWGWITSLPLLPVIAALGFVDICGRTPYGNALKIAGMGLTGLFCGLLIAFNAAAEIAGNHEVANDRRQ